MFFCIFLETIKTNAELFIILFIFTSLLSVKIFLGVGCREIYVSRHPTPSFWENQIKLWQEKTKFGRAREQEDFQENDYKSYKNLDRAKELDAETKEREKSIKELATEINELEVASNKSNKNKSTNNQ